MICFRSLQNWYLQQRRNSFCKIKVCCDLLSFFAKLIFTTTKTKGISFVTLLWFAFVLCKTDIYNNNPNKISHSLSVVICFRSLQNWYLQQRLKVGDTIKVSCDLLSFFAKLIFTTTKDWLWLQQIQLWFAFVLCKTDIYNNFNAVVNWNQWVVICFRSLQNWYLQQQTIEAAPHSASCDLLSFFAKLIFTTTLYML